MIEHNNGYIGIVLPAESAKSAEAVTELYSPPQLKDIFNIDNLYKGYLQARKGKRSRKAVYDFDNNLWSELQDLSKSIEAGTYMPSKYRSFKIYEPKERTVVAPSFRDSVVQHTIYNAIYEIFNASFIHDSYGCRKGKGTHSASDKLQEHFRSCKGDDYYLQMDIHKYYYSINHKTLQERLERKIKDKALVNLIMLFVDTQNTKGLHIGNLLSQLFGLIYLDWYDNFAKRTLKAKKYVRYVDDFVVVGLTYIDARKILETTKRFLYEKLGLVLSKFRIAKIKKGCNFVGYRTWRSKKYVRKRSLYHFSKSLRKFDINAIMSMLGHAKRTSTIGHYKNKIKETLCTTNTFQYKHREFMELKYATEMRVCKS